MEIRITPPNPSLPDASWHVWHGESLLGHGATEREAWTSAVETLLGTDDGEIRRVAGLSAEEP